ncbi:MAG: AntA/AntB antirepressor [Podoviridae sp. ctbh1]|nr:MAG: AntA/AntB antirepressor [Podoviridae sp. ctbh1]
MTNASLSHQLELNQQPLVNVFEAVIGNLKQLAVNARDLHTFLQVGKVFAAWIQERIGKYEFIENEDFIVFSKSGNNLKGGRPTNEYHLTLDMAKELSMVENNVKGREARRYFITMEKKVLGYSNQQPVLASPKLTSEQVKQLNNKIHNIKHCFHQNESANQNIMNRLRVDLSLRQMSDFRECHFNQAMQILDGLNNVAKAYSEWQYELNRMVVDWIIRDGRPWTPDVVKKLRAELDVTINHHPDWNKLAALVHR